MLFQLCFTEYTVSQWRVINTYSVTYINSFITKNVLSMYIAKYCINLYSLSISPLTILTYNIADLNDNYFKPILSSTLCVNGDTLPLTE